MPYILVILIIVLLVVLFVKLCRWNYPTWKGIIISAILGMLPLYLFLCAIGLMGEDGNTGQ